MSVGIGVRVVHPAWWNGAVFALSWIAVVAACVLVWATAITLLP
jgi:hypothetical protein